jgi:hypothetical protein
MCVTTPRNRVGLTAVALLDGERGIRRPLRYRASALPTVRQLTRLGNRSTYLKVTEIHYTEREPPRLPESRAVSRSIVPRLGSGSWRRVYLSPIH